MPLRYNLIASLIRLMSNQPLQVNFLISLIFSEKKTPALITAMDLFYQHGNLLFISFHDSLVLKCGKYVHLPQLMEKKFPN